MRLLADIGSSRCKYARYEKDAVAFCDAVPVDDLADGLRASFAKHLGGAPQSVHVASVAGAEHDARFAQTVREAFGVEPVALAPALPVCGVTTRYRPEQLGVDRCLALVAAWHRAGRSCIVVDCGTAVTLDYLDAGGLHHGGVIVPGAALLHDALWRGTHRLGAADAGADNVPATDTAAAIGAGCRRMLHAALNGIIGDLRRRGDDDALIVGTGGGVQALAEVTAGDFLHAPNLVFEGMVIVGESRRWRA